MEDADWMHGEDVAEEELRLLEAMAAVSGSMQKFNQVLATLNRQTVELSKELGTAERQLNALYLPFQAAIYEMQSARNKQAASAPAATTVSTPVPQRTEL